MMARSSAAMGNGPMMPLRRVRPWLVEFGIASPRSISASCEKRGDASAVISILPVPGDSRLVPGSGRGQRWLQGNLAYAAGRQAGPSGSKLL